ncbi:MAG: hypothetical protein IPK29_09435 [Betaproteobacteria bacterium]|jgi:hypothetical protein|nr:hypothetical protein [Betaproteobacteria bacterium]
MRTKALLVTLALFATTAFAQPTNDMLKEVDVGIAKAEKLTPTQQKQVRELRDQAVRVIGKKGGESEAREHLWNALKILGLR